MNKEFEIETIGHLYDENFITEVYDNEDLIVRLTYENGPDKVICEIHGFNKEFLLLDFLNTIKKAKKKLVNEQ